MVRVLFLEYQPGRLSSVIDVFQQYGEDLEYDVRVMTEYVIESVDIVIYDVIVFDCHILPQSTFSKHGLSLLDEKCILISISQNDLVSIEKLNLSKFGVDNFLISDSSTLLELTIKRELELLNQKKEIIERRQAGELLNAITDITTSLLEIQNLDEIARLVIDRIVKHFHFEDCVIYEVNSDGKSLTQVAAKGPKEDVAFHVKNPITLQFGQGVVGHVAETGNPLILDNASKDPRYHIDDDIRNSEISVPIKLNGNVIGVIDSEHYEYGYYNDRDLRNLEAVASVIAIKFNAAHLRKEKHDAQQELQKSLDEKTVLLSEVHHRVKNNLAIISGLLHLQSKDRKHPELVQIMLEMGNRIQSIAGVHELLYNSDSFADITFDDYVKTLFDTISSTITKRDQVEVELDLDIDHELKININQAVPLGLILNELVTNSFKYAFANVSNPKISFSLHLKEGIIHGNFSDNGPGFSTDNLATPKSLGFTVIKALFKQLEASVEFNDDNVYPLKFNFNYYQNSILG